MDNDGTVDLETEISDQTGGFNGNLHDDDAFGSAVTGIGDLDGDGVNDIAVGTPLDDDGGDNRGAVWILFMNMDGTVKSRKKISGDSGLLKDLLFAGDRFGRSLANTGDCVTDLAAGSPGFNDGGLDRGAIWILYLDTDGTVARKKEIIARESEFDLPIVDGDNFGEVVANAGDIDKDGITDLAAGVPFDDDGGPDSGAVFILFMNNRAEVTELKKLSSTQDIFNGILNSDDHFGAAIASIGDLNNRRAVDLAVGAPLDDNGGINKGTVWILFLDDVDTRTECERNALLRFPGIGDCDWHQPLPRSNIRSCPPRLIVISSRSSYSFNSCSSRREINEKMYHKYHSADRLIHCLCCCPGWPGLRLG